MSQRILMVLTSHDRLGDTGKPTGFWLEELAAPYYACLDAGAEVVLPRPPAASRRWIPAATPRRARPRPPGASSRTRMPSSSWPPPVASTR